MRVRIGERRKHMPRKEVDTHPEGDVLPETAQADTVDEGEDKKPRKPRKKMSKGKRTAIICIVVVVGLLVAGLTYLTLNEYNPEEVTKLAGAQGSQPLAAGSTLTIATLNTGYAGLSHDEDFFMDGGTGVRAASQTLVNQNMQGIADTLSAIGAQAYLLQEVDIDSDRTFNVNEMAFYQEKLGMQGVFAYNYNASYVPYPIPTIGHVESGLVTLTNLQISDASRIQLPVPFSWPVSTVNLKRCLLVERMPVSGTGRELVLINLHLEAYDTDGKGKKEQTQMLRQILEEEYAKGNYVIAGGDFNQTFEDAAEFPVVNDQNWAPGVLTFADIPEGFSFQFDPEVATCRLLDGPYTDSYDTSQVYSLDGFIVSDNVRVQRVGAMDTGFANTDHEPVVLVATLA